MRRCLAIMLALLVGGCEQDNSADPEGQGAWLTLNRNGVASVFVRYDNGETEKWLAPYTTSFGADGQSLGIVVRSERCGDLQFQAVLGSADLKLVTQGQGAERARPCRITSGKAPAWKLLTKIVNSAKG